MSQRVCALGRGESTFETTLYWITNGTCLQSVLCEVIRPRSYRYICARMVKILIGPVVKTLMSYRWCIPIVYSESVFHILSHRRWIKKLPDGQTSSHHHHCQWHQLTVVVFFSCFGRWRGISQQASLEKYCRNGDYLLMRLISQRLNGNLSRWFQWVLEVVWWKFEGQTFFQRSRVWALEI